MIIDARDTFGATQAAGEEYRMGRVGRGPRDAILDHVTLWGQVGGEREREREKGGGEGGGGGGVRMIKLLPPAPSQLYIHL